MLAHKPTEAYGPVFVPLSFRPRLTGLRFARPVGICGFYSEIVTQPNILWKFGAIKIEATSVSGI